MESAAAEPPLPDTTEVHSASTSDDSPGFAAALDLDDDRLPGFAAALDDQDDNGTTGFAAAALEQLDTTDSNHRRPAGCSWWWCSRYPCCSNRGRTVVALVFALSIVLLVVLYFVVPWVPILEEILDWVDERGFRGIAMLFVLHLLCILAIFAPSTVIEYGWVFLRGWKAVPVLILSYIIAIAIMLVFGNTVLRPCIMRHVHGSPLLRATQRVLDGSPYAWYVAFQFWSIVPWRAGVYCAHVLAPHANLAGIGLAVLLGQFPDLFYRAFLATEITDLDSLVTGRLDTPLDTAVFWGTVALTTLISLLLYVKIRDAFMTAAGTEAGETDGVETESFNDDEESAT